MVLTNRRLLRQFCRQTIAEGHVAAFVRSATNPSHILQSIHWTGAETCCSTASTNFTKTSTIGQQKLLAKDPSVALAMPHPSKKKLSLGVPCKAPKSAWRMPHLNTMQPRPRQGKLHTMSSTIGKGVDTVYRRLCIANKLP